MNLKQGDTFEVSDGGIIQITHADVNTVKYKYVHGSSRQGEISNDVFQQFLTNGYFKALGGTQ